MKNKESTPIRFAVVSELMNIYPLITYFINNLLKVKEDIHEKKRKELDYKTRLAIAKYLNDGLNIIQISKILGRDDAVLYREVNKRSVDGVYNPLLAEKML